MKKTKLITSLLSTTSILGAASVLMTNCSCSNADEQLAKEVITKAVEEFREIAKVPRPTHFNKQIREYLMNRIKQLGYTPCTDYTYPEKEEDQISDPANVWFEVPASAGYEDHKGIILQAHMDMVVAGLDEAAAKVTPINVVYHEDTYTLTSDHKTSLGADNGIGLGLIFALLQNEKIKHGPLTILFTADEEQGMLGAKRLADPKFQQKFDVLHKQDYLISLDGELHSDGYYRSCQGNVGHVFTHTFNTETLTNVTPFNVFVDGFLGGHSGNDISKNRCNATVFLLSVLELLDDDNLQIIKYNNEVWDSEAQEMKDVVFSRTAIPSNGRVTFVSTKSEDDINAAFKKAVELAKVFYTGENWDDVKIDIKPEATGSYNALTKKDSQKVLDLMTNSEDNGFVYGVYVKEQESQRPLVSVNISPFSIKPDADPTKTKMSIELFSRAVSKEAIDLLRYAQPEIWSKFFPDSPVDPENPSALTYPWDINLWSEGDETLKICDEAYKAIGISNPYIRDADGAIEPAWFYVGREDLQQTCLGTKFDNVHTKNETCYLKPLVNTVRVLKYIFDNFK